jgi:hypothetical protein
MKSLTVTLLLLNERKDLYNCTTVWNSSYIEFVSAWIVLMICIFSWIYMYKITIQKLCCLSSLHYIVILLYINIILGVIIRYADVYPQVYTDEGQELR